MIPAECDLTRRPMSERIVFDAVRDNLPDSWRVFHSFDYVTRDLNKKRWDGEIDFLLYHPEKGMLVIEVEGGAFSYRNGQRHQEDRPIDPVEQAKRLVCRRDSGGGNQPPERCRRTSRVSENASGEGGVTVSGSVNRSRCSRLKEFFSP